MGVMCSLLGHDYGDPGVERERVEDGNEVVVTAKRVERCRSCGHERTISENTEVTALSAAAGVVREPDGTVVVAPDESDGETTVDEGKIPEPTAMAAESSDGSPETASGPIVRDDGPRTDVESKNESETPVDTVEPGDEREPVGPSTVDDSSTGSGESGSGVIADSVTTTSALDRSANGSGRADDPADDPPSIDRIGDEPKRRDPPQRAPGEWPDEPGRRAASATGVVGSGGSAASTGQWPDEEGTDTAAEERTDGRNGGSNDGPERPTGGSFVCASCGFDAAVIDSPHRAGDICPNCHRGYLAWETRKG